MKYMTRKNFLLVFTFFFIGAQPAFASTADSSFPINATISTACTITSTGMDFGEVGIAGAATVQTDSTGTLSVTCTTGGAYWISLDGGLHPVAAQRNIQSGLNTLAYDLYKDAARGTVWTAATAPTAGVGTSAAQTITIYGRIAAGLPFALSNGVPFTDTVLVTIIW
ncbi:Csu type fimbrial protein [Sandarakinorhabdus limnophila]|uniref:Csu type fimbrial protein n=1 Tax=Sandarakinorhabdus limnophila TaxID=210512 RepID=UPI0026EF23C0|nr:spore coat U domain-containing protein [Sandarakinorhabdus limnophila]MCM0033800.1 spore coat U domain-containing protein [Sandarakinorhabdus limnophila]